MLNMAWVQDLDHGCNLSPQGVFHLTFEGGVGDLEIKHLAGILVPKTIHARYPCRKKLIQCYTEKKGHALKQYQFGPHYQVILRNFCQKGFLNTNGNSFYLTIFNLCL